MKKNMTVEKSVANAIHDLYLEGETVSKQDEALILEARKGKITLEQLIEKSMR